MACAAACQDTPETRARAALGQGDKEQLADALKDISEQNILNKLLIEVFKFQGPVEKRKELLDVLLQHVADTNFQHDGHNTPIHYAAECGDVDCIQALLDKGADPTARNSNIDTALHSVIRGVIDKTFTETDGIKCLRLLLRYNTSILFAKNYSDFTPLELAQKYNKSDVCKFLQSKEKDTENPSQEIQDLYIILQAALNNQDESDFETNFERADIANIEKVDKNSKNTLLQTAIHKGLERVTELLINRGIDVNMNSRSNPNFPIFIAIEEEHTGILEKLLKTGKCDLSIRNNDNHKRTALHIAAITNSNNPCTDLLLKNSSVEINAQDFKNCTALHYAAKNNKDDIVATLLEFNANIFLTNNDGDPAFFYTKPNPINKFLDDKITTENLITDDDYTLVFNFDFLFSKDIKDCESSTYHYRRRGVEMADLEMLSNSPEHRHLLNHPLIKAFLHLKWYRISWFFYCNFVFYLLYLTSLSFHVYRIITPNCSNGSFVESENQTKHGFLWIITLIFLVLLAIRELFQLCISFCEYINQLENLLELSLIFMTTFLLFFPSANRQVIQPVSAFTILLAFTEMILLTGRHPILSTHIKLFFRVVTNFLKLLLWYSIFILGFGFAFYIVFSHCDINNFFYDLHTSIFKTTVMVTGEFEAGELKFDSLSVTSHIIFLLFLFFIAIVLLNLLTGLAVNDTQAIISESELHNSVAQVRLYAQLESILLGGCLCGHLPFSWCQNILLSTLMEKDQYLLSIKPNKDNKTTPDIRRYTKDCSDILSSPCISRCTCLRRACSWCFMFNTIVKDARAIKEKKNDMVDMTTLLSELKNLESMLNKMLNQSGVTKSS